MKIQIVLLWGILAFLSSFDVYAVTENCPVPSNFKKLSCSGSEKVKSLTELINYKNTLGIKKNTAKNLIIDFNLNSPDLSIATPCSITIAENAHLNINGNLCLHGDRGVDLGENVSLTARDVRLEALDEIFIRENNIIHVQKLEFVSLGISSHSQVRIKGNESITASSMLIDSFDRSSIGPSSNINVSGDFGMYTLGDDNAVIAQNVKIVASKIEISAGNVLRLGSNVYLSAVNELILNGAKGFVSGKSTTLIAAEKLGNAFLNSAGKNSFSIDKSSGFLPLEINFDASKIQNVISYSWSFGDGETLVSTLNKVNHKYLKVGIFTATLKYATSKDKRGEFNYRSAGSVQVTVKEIPNLPPVAHLSCVTNNLLVICNALSSYDPELQPLIYNFTYGDGYEETNATGISSHAFSEAGLSTVKLVVTDNFGATADSIVNVQPVLPQNVLPLIELNCVSSKINQIDCDAIGSKDADGQIVSLTYTFDDGITIVSSDSTTSINHLFSLAGGHTITLIAIDNDGGVSTLVKSIQVKANALPIADFSCSSDLMFQVSCTSLAIDPDAPFDFIQKTVWNFSDGTIIDSLNSTQVHSFATGGSKTITQTVYDSFGGSSQVSKVVLVKDNQAPIASINCFNTNMLAECNALSSYDIEGQQISFQFDFGDGQFEENITGLSTHAYLHPGIYNVKLTVTDSLGAKGFSTTVIQAVLPPNILPVATLNCNSDRPFTLSCNANGSSDADGQIVSYKYLFDNGQLIEKSNSDAFSIRLGTSGSHTVTLTVIDNDGGESIIANSFNVLANTLPIATFLCEPNYLPQKIKCKSTSSEKDLDDSIVNFEWYVGDQLVQTGIQNTFDYATNSSGDLNITLAVVDTFSGRSGLTQKFTIVDSIAPVISFQYPSDHVFDANSDQSFYIQISDNEKINFSTVELEINGNKISSRNYSIDSQNNKINVAFNYPSPLNIGSNLITAKVLDSSGNQNIASVVYISSDLVAPIISVFPIDGTHFTSQNGEIVISFDNASDANWSTLSLTLDEFEVDSNSYKIVGNKIILNVASGELLAAGDNIFNISLSDTTGNVASKTVNFILDPSTLSFDFIPENNYKFDLASNSVSIYPVDDTNDLNWNSLRVYINDQLIDPNNYSVFKGVVGEEKVSIPINVGDESTVVKIEMNDSTGKKVSGEAKYFLRDQIPPIVAFNVANGTEFQNEDRPYLYASLTDASAIDFTHAEVKLNGSVVSSSVIDSLNNKIYFKFDNAIHPIIGENILSLKVADVEGNSGETSLNFRVSDSEAPTVSLSPVPGNSFYSNILTITATVYDMSEINWQMSSVKVNGVPAPLLNYYIDNNTIIINLNEEYSFELGANTVSIEIEDIWGNHRTVNANYNLLEKRSVQVGFSPDRNSHFKNATPTTNILFNYPVNVDWNSLKIKINDIEVSNNNFSKINSNTLSLNFSGNYSLKQGMNKLAVNYLDLDGNSIIDSLAYFLDDIYAPTLSMFPANNTLLPDQNLNFTFNVSDAGGVKAESLIVTLNGSIVNSSKYSFNGSSGNGSLKLNPGANSVTISVSDKVGNIAKISQAYTVGDSVGPTYNFNPISWSEFSDTNPQSFTISINESSTVNESTIQLWLNTRLIPSSKYNYNPLTKTVSVHLDNEFAFVGGNNIVKIKAADSLGHYSEQNVTYKYLDKTGPLVSFSPSTGTSFTNNNSPEIKVQFSDASDILLGQASLYLNNKLLNASVDYRIDTDNKEIVINFSGNKLSSGNNTLRVEVQDAFINKSIVSSDYQLIDTLAPIASVMPASGTVFNNQNQSIAISLSDISSIDWATLEVKLKGASIDNSNIKFIGNSFSIQFGDALLFNAGSNIISYKISDTSGNQLNSSVQYSMNDIFPAEFSFDPISGTEINTINKIINIAIIDFSPLNLSTLSLKLNGQVLPSSYYSILDNNISLALNGNYSFRKGLNRIEVAIKDDKGNLGSASASYIVNPIAIDLNPPQISIIPVSGIITSVPEQIIITVNDESGIDFTKYKFILNGQEVSKANLQLFPELGKIIFTPDKNTGFNSGRNIFTTFIADNLNNLGGKSVFYDLTSSSVNNNPPVVTFSPAGGTLVNNTPTIVAFVSDASGIDYSTLQVFLNGIRITDNFVQVDKSKGKITLQFDSLNPLPNITTNKIIVTVKNINGLLSNAAVGFDQLDSVSFKTINPYSVDNNFVPQAGYTNCVILEEGHLRCWGFNIYGQMGLGDNLNRSLMIPANIPNALINEPVASTASNANSICALTTMGDVYCWGYNSVGQLGYGNTLIIGDNEPPTSEGHVNIGEKAIQIAVGGQHACALLESGNVKCWGSNLNGQLGQVSLENIGDNELPNTIANISVGEKVKQVAAGVNYTCLLLESGNVRCFGAMDWGDVGNPGQSPINIPNVSLSGKVKQLTTGATHACALLESGDVQCWGAGNMGLLGYGNHQDVLSPSAAGTVSVGGPVAKVVAGGIHTCALLVNHKVSCWGRAIYNGHDSIVGWDNLPSSSPYVDYGPGTAIDINIGGAFTCLTFDDGGYKCWGDNWLGVLGQGSAADTITVSEMAQLPPINLGAKIKVASNLLAYFESTPYYGPSPLLLVFDASKSISSSGVISNYHWDFGDGNSLDTIESSASYVYNNNGVYTAALTITNSSGQTNSFTRTITVGPVNNPPFAFFTASSDFGVAPFSASFDGSGSFDVNGTIANYSWIFGDGNIQTTTTPIVNHNYTHPGTYLVMMSVKDDAGASADAFPMAITVKELNMNPFASFNCITTGKNISCNAFSSGDLDGSIVKFEWNFGDGAIASQYEVAHTYATDGNYNISLTVTDNNGATANYTMPILIDTLAPNIIANLADNIITNNPDYHFSILIDELNNLETVISLNGQAAITSKDHIIDGALTLEEGLNTISIVSIDGNGNKTSKTLVSNIVLDTIAPELASLSPADGSEVNSQNIEIKGAFNEKLSALTINDQVVNLNADGKSFIFNYKIYTEGNHELIFNASDLAGNTSIHSSFINVQLKILYPELISIQKIASGDLKITGAKGSVKSGVQINLGSGFLNKVTLLANPDGSFETNLKYFTSAKITAIDLSTGRQESAQLNFDVDTTLAGTIKDTDGNPLPGVKVTIKNTDAGSVLTDASGIFSFSNPPTGDQQLIIDAQNVPVEAVGPNKKFSVMEMPVSIGTKQSNVISNPIYLAPLKYDGTETIIDPGVSTTVETAQVEGAAIEIPGNVQVSFPEGNTLKVINMAEVSKDKTTVPVLKQVEPQTVVALEPSGLTFSEPVKLTLPNVNEFPAGMQLMIYSKNSKTGRWEIDGVAKVNDVGDSIVTQDGMGITHFSEVYAAPMGLKYSQINSQDKPGADTFNGAVSTSIDFPGYKSLGTEIAPKLLYRSNWAHPTATVTNIFQIPSEVMFINTNGIRTVEPVHNNDATDQNTFATWVAPESVDVTFRTGDYVSPIMTLTGIPNQAVVSYAMDFSKQQSGVMPFSSDYVIHLKRMIIRSDYLQFKDVTAGWGDPYNENLQTLSEVMPTSLKGNLYIQNKKQSSAGRGWMIGGVQKIINPGNSRLMLEEDNGGISTYVVSDKIQTIKKLPEGFSGVQIDNQNNLIVSTSSDNVTSIDLDTGASTNLFSAPKFTGVYSSTIQYKRHECEFWIKSKYIGKWCERSRDHYYCLQQKRDYQLTPTRKYVINSPNSNGYILATESGLITQESGGSTIITGGLKNAPTGDQSGDSFFCASTASCSNLRNVTEIPANTCPASPPSSGLTYEKGSNDGDLVSARFNTIKSIAANPVQNGFAVADYGNNKIRYVNLDTKTVSTIAGNEKTDDSGDGGLAVNASMYHPRGLVYDPDGNLYISTENGFIRKIDRSGRISKIAGDTNGVFYDSAIASKMYLSKPYGLAYNADQKFLYVADSGNNRVLRIDLNTSLAQKVAGNGNCQTETATGEKGPALSASLCNPEFINLDINNNLIIADGSLDSVKHNMIRRVIFSDSSGGLLKFDSVANDNSSLIRNTDGSFTRSLRSGIQIFFDKEGKHISTTDRIGKTISNQYDSNGNLISQADPLGGNIYYNYSFGLLRSIRYSNDNREFNFSYDLSNHLSSVTYPDGTTKQFGYDSNGLLTSETDQKNNTATYTYNEWKRLQSVKRPDGKSITINDSQTLSMVNNYSGGNTGSLKNQGVDPGQLADGIKDAKGITTSFVSDSSGYVSTIIDGDGKITKVERDDRGRPIKIIRPDNSIVEFTYDQKTGDLISKSDSSTGTTEKWEYDNFGNLISHTDGIGRKVSNYYDAKGLLLKTTNETLGLSTNYTYNSIGQLATQTDPLGNISSVVYDNRGNVSQSITPDGKITNYQYYLSGLVQKVIDANSTSSLYEYDNMNRLTAVTTGGNQKTQYNYQETGELIQTIDPYNRVTNFYYDNLGQLIKKVGVRREITELSYDENGNTIQEKTSNGQLKYFYYDNLNRLVRKLLPDDTYNYSYDIRGNVVSIANSLTKIDLTYQHFDGGDVVLSAHSYGIGNGADLPNTILNYSYNESGEKIAMATPKGTFQYNRDIAGRLKSITNLKGEVFNIGYDQNQRVKQISTPATITNFSFDSIGFNTQIKHTRKSGALIDQVIYGRDETGNRISKTTNSGSTIYEYDKNYQLLKATNPNLSLESFTYDSLGNRVSDSNSTYVYDQTKQLIQEDYKYLYTFDPAGNLTSKQEKGFTGNVENFDYDSENRMRVFKLYKNGILAREASYTYDALGRRIEKVIVDHEDVSRSYTKRFAYDGNEILFEQDETNTINKTYTHSTLRTDDVLAVSTSGTSYFYLKDSLGSITNVVDSNGIIKAHLEYSSFGKILSITDSIGNDVSSNSSVEIYFAYTGREWDSESNLYHYRARAYSAELGRFLQPDRDSGRLSAPMTHINKYSYVRNNPINRIDPSGMISVDVGDIVGYMFGGPAYDMFRDDIRKFFTDNREVLIDAAIIGGAIGVSFATAGTATPALIAMGVGAGVGGGFALANGTNVGKGMLGGLVGSSAAFIGGAGGAALFGIGGAATGGFVGGMVGAQQNAQITRGKNASHGELLFGGIAGAVGGAVGSGIVRGDGWFTPAATTANEFNRSMTTGVAPVTDFEWSGGRLNQINPNQ